MVNVDILEHELIPKHDILSKKERDELLKKFNITKEMLPTILSSDPVVNKISAKPGDVIKIIRESPTSGESVYYRTVK